MDFKLTEEQEQIKVLIKEFAEREIDINDLTERAHKAGRAKTVAELRANMPVDLLKKMHDVGLRQLGVPEKYGGGGVAVGGHLTRAIAAEAAGYHMEIGGRLLTQGWFSIQGIAGRHTTEEQKDWFFSQYMADHTMMFAVAGSEPAGSTDLNLPYVPKDNPGAIGKVFAHREGNEWVINGDKMFSSSSGVAGIFCVEARTNKKGLYLQSISWIAVPKDAPGLTQEVNHLIGGEIAGNFQNHFDNVRVPASNLMGEVNKASVCGGDSFSAKIIAYVDIFGHAQKVYDGLVEYAKQRIGGGRPIIQHSHIAQMLGEWAIKREATRSLIYRAAWENDQAQLADKPPDFFWTLSCFQQIRKVCWELVTIALEVYGGVGVTPEMPVERFLRRVATWYITGSVPSLNAIKCSMIRNNHKIIQG